MPPPVQAPVIDKGAPLVKVKIPETRQIGFKKKLLRIEHGALTLLRFELGLRAGQPGTGAGEIGLAA
jgi:hypothetical protein